MPSNTISPNRITNVQDIEINTNGPGEINRMFCYSGLVEVNIAGGMPHPSWSQEIISFTIGREFTPPDEEVIKITATASIASCRTDGMASFAGWRIFAAAGELDPSVNKVRLNLCVGTRDTQAYLDEVMFQTHVLAKVT